MPPHLFTPKLKGGQNTMPTKAELYAQMAEKVTTQLTGSWQEWAGFLTTASRLYKYPFHEQLMIYAQRPDATACAMFLIFPTPEPVNISALPGCGSWRRAIWIRCRPCLSAPMMFPVMTLPDSSPR